MKMQPNGRPSGCRKLMYTRVLAAVRRRPELSYRINPSHACSITPEASPTTRRHERLGNFHRGVDAVAVDTMKAVTFSPVAGSPVAGAWRGFVMGPVLSSDSVLLAKTN
jgi:hypothetical protein